MVSKIAKFAAIASGLSIFSGIVQFEIAKHTGDASQIIPSIGLGVILLMLSWTIEGLLSLKESEA